MCIAINQQDLSCVSSEVCDFFFFMQIFNNTFSPNRIFEFILALNRQTNIGITRYDRKAIISEEIINNHAACCLNETEQMVGEKSFATENYFQRSEYSIFYNPIVQYFRNHEESLVHINWMGDMLTGLPVTLFYCLLFCQGN